MVEKEEEKEVIKAMNEKLKCKEVVKNERSGEEVYHNFLTGNLFYFSFNYWNIVAVYQNGKRKSTISKTNTCNYRVCDDFVGNNSLLFKLEIVQK